METAVVFFEDYLYEGHDGKLVFSPTQSPENTPGNSNSQASFNATMDVAVAKELLRNTIAASRELGRNEDRIPTWESMLAKAHYCTPKWTVGVLGHQRFSCHRYFFYHRNSVERVSAYSR